MKQLPRVFCYCSIMLLLFGCGPKLSPTISPVQAVASTQIGFEDVSAKAGITFKHYSGAQGQKYMPETVGSGVAFIDYDGDGRLDILYVNSTDWPNAKVRKPHYLALYHNNGDGTFTDVTEKAGLKRDIYGMGACVGDYNNDGLPDIYITCIGPNILFKNNGNGTFSDVTKQAGVAGVPVDPGGMQFKWSSSAAWCDFNKDGIPDLFVCNYVKWTPDTDVFCASRTGAKSYCAPINFEGNPCTLYKGNGDGTFTDVSVETGISKYIGKAFGCIVADFNGDGWPDIAVTNDTSANFLFINHGGVRFEEQAKESGIAYPESGLPKAGMGIDASDFMNDGKLGLLTGNFSKECLSIYTNDGKAMFTEKGYPLGVAQSSLKYLTFGLMFLDADMDGKQDIFTADGHIDNYVHESDTMITYKERSLLYHNLGGKFQEIGESSGNALQTKWVGRGCAWGDFDMDGKPDIAICSNNEGGFLLHNTSKVEGGWIGLKLKGTKSTRDGWGAVVTVKGGGNTQTYHHFSGGSFLSSRQVWPLFGLNTATIADEIHIDWPSGLKTDIKSLKSGHYYEVTEGQPEAILFH